MFYEEKAYEKFGLKALCLLFLVSIQYSVNTEVYVWCMMKPWISTLKYSTAINIKWRILANRKKQRRCKLRKMRKWEREVIRVVSVDEDQSEGVNFTNILRAAFSYESFARSFFVLRFKVCTFLAQKYWCKSCKLYVGEIDSR